MKTVKDFINEAAPKKKSGGYEIYHELYSDAVGAALEYAMKKGYSVDEDEFFSSVSSGPRKPSGGKTNSFRIHLTKNDKPVNKRLVFQIYNRETDKKTYELTAYVS